MSQENLLKQLRNTLPEVLKNEELINDYIGFLQEYKAPVALAYQGLLRSAKAEFAVWPGTKLQHFNEGKELVETAVRSSPASMEVRFVRILIQCNAPAFLGYSSQINNDIRFILSSLHENKNVAAGESQFMLQHLIRLDCFESNDKAQIKN